MTHKALNQQWTPEEIVKVREIMLANSDLKPGERIAKAAKAINRTPNAVQFKWHMHIKKVMATEDVIVKQEDLKPVFLQSKQVTAYEDMNGKIHLNRSEAVLSNINYILEEMEKADNLYEYIVNNWDKLEYIKKNA